MSASASCECGWTTRPGRNHTPAQVASYLKMHAGHCAGHIKRTEEWRAQQERVLIREANRILRYSAKETR